MRKTMRRTRGSQRGFTLPEILVAVAMVGVLAAVVLPTVMGQMSKSEISRVVRDLQAVDQAAQTFRSDVGRWPASTDQLILQISAGGSSLDGGTYAASEAALWQGPYLARTAAGAVATGAGGTVSTALIDTDASWPASVGTAPSSPFVALAVTGLSAADQERVSAEIDGNEATAATLGRVRYVSNDTLYYLAVPFK